MLTGSRESITEVTRAALSVGYKMLISVLKISFKNCVCVRKAFDASLPKSGYMLSLASIKHRY